MLPVLNDVIELARSAGAILRAGYGQQHDIRFKAATDLVTEIDHQSEKLIISSIQSRFPTHTIIAEESGHLPGSAENCWYVDPLDGTVNYAHGIPFFCVSIAYGVGHDIQLGVVYDPMRDECFSAEKGCGATLNGQPIRVSDATEMIRALMVTGFPYQLWESDNNNLDNYSRVSRVSQGVRRLGSAALDTAYVGCGRFDGYWEVSIKPWDVAAGGLIVREAGGIISNMQGEPDILQKPCSLVAGNAAIHPQLLAKLNEA